MRAELKELQRRLGTTTVYVTHDQVEALTLGDRIAVLREGAVQQVGTPDEVWGRPVNRFVARFVGSPPMRFLPPAVLGIDAPDGAVAGVRPEHVVIGGEGTPAEVTLVEPVGSEAFVHLLVDGHEVVARVDAAARPRPGDELRVRGTVVHLFDAESGERLPWR
jgi:ABC-type sugar transport system ATPase subunit